MELSDCLDQVPVCHYSELKLVSDKNNMHAKALINGICNVSFIKVPA